MLLTLIVLMTYPRLRICVVKWNLYAHPWNEPWLCEDKTTRFRDRASNLILRTQLAHKQKHVGINGLHVYEKTKGLTLFSQWKTTNFQRIPRYAACHSRSAKSENYVFPIVLSYISVCLRPPTSPVIGLLNFNQRARTYSSSRLPFTVTSQHFEHLAHNVNACSKKLCFTVRLDSLTSRPKTISWARYELFHIRFTQKCRLIGP